MRIQQLLYLQKVVALGNMTEATKELFIAQPTLSSAIKQLEKEMGITILIRGKKGVSLTEDVREFMQYAQQILDQVQLLERRYGDQSSAPKIFSVAAQHYAFAVDAFVQLLKEIGQSDYQASLKEMRTYEVIEDVANLHSEIGIVYLSRYNHQVMENSFQEKELSFTPLFKAHPHVFLYRNHPLAGKKSISLADLLPYYWEETLADQHSPKSIIVSDRATLFNLAIGLKGYTISSGIINADLNGDDIIARPLISDEYIEIGYLTNRLHQLSSIGQKYLGYLRESIEKNAKR
ncbi:LysR family transcriptional regulator [Lactobacillus delbrueckii subsp. bulgaricus]|nr:LysR family transcriptional regulator [Lactobacillus delbrueckii subsp. bulgaricus]MBT8916885.1 LysR family transcriptional regulator [Lactobacillus delbrueckii subsp. bulgaricus]MBT8986767.1 LysR family transcriptional regulator [Lactobacillus delbrueckii subsp. bulgaricus]